MGILEQALTNAKRRLETEVEAARAKEKREIARAIADHSSVAEHYWQPRHQLECRLGFVTAVLELIEGLEDG